MTMLIAPYIAVILPVVIATFFVIVYSVSITFFCPYMGKNLYFFTIASPAYLLWFAVTWEDH